MAGREVKPDIYSVGAIDWDRRLFDELIPLPDGTSYNSYLIRGSEKTALIDAVDPTKEAELVSNLKSLGVKKIDYIIANHAEQDHSGAIPKILEIYPSAKIVCTPKCKEFLVELLLIPQERFIVVKDRETISLGNKTLEFVYAPWVHWPETMLTYLREDKVLFTCDLFGSHFAASGLFAADEATVYEAAKRYYAEIMMPFRTNIQKHMMKIKELQIEIIAPSHGPAYSKPLFILNAYADWISDAVKKEVVIAYISMHGSTKKMVEHFADALMKRGLNVKLFNLSRTDIGKFAMALVDASTLVIASPTVLAGAHPNVIYAAYLANALRPKLKFAAIIGSYNWGSRMIELLKTMLASLKVEMLEPVLIKGFPKENDFAALDKLAEEILNKNRSI